MLIFCGMIDSQKVSSQDVDRQEIVSLEVLCPHPH